MRKSQPKDRPATDRYVHSRNGSASAPNKSDALMSNPAFSRRTFISATAIVGTLNFLGSIASPSGTVIAAYADEADNTHFSIYVLSREEVPVMALRKTDKGNVAVEGVKVTIASLYNQKTLTVTTGKDGFAAARIRDLSFECDDETATQFSFYGDVVATADGYRELHFTQEFIQSGVPAAKDGSRSNTIEIPMEIDDNTMYLRSVSLDDVDVLHSAAPAYVGDYSTEDHTLSLELMLPHAETSTRTANITLLVDDAEWARTTASSNTENPTLINAGFTDAFLNKLKPGQTVKLRLEAEGMPTKTATLPLTFQNALVLAGGSAGTALSAGLTPTPNDMGDKRPGFRAVAWLFGENDTMYLGFPSMPFQFFDDAAGNFGFSVVIAGLTFFKYVNGEDKAPDVSFRKFNGKAGSAAFDSWKNTAKESYKDFTDTMDRAAGNLSQCGVSKFSRMITATFEISGMAYGKSAYIDEETWQGDTKGTFDIAIAATLGINANFGCQAWILAFPVYVDIDFSATVMARFAFGVSFKNFFEDWAWGHHYVDGCPLQFIFFTNVQGGLSVGLGIRGLLGAAVRGNGSVVAQHIYDLAEGKPMPHGILKLTYGVQVVIQVIIYTKSFNLIEPGIGGPWESWGFFSSSKLEETPLAWNLNDADLSDAKMPSQETLANVSEYGATLSAAVDTASVTDEDGANDGEGSVDEGFSTFMPETYQRTRNFLSASAPKDLIAAGPKSAAGFASPYAALNATGKLKSGATGTSDLALTGTQADFANVATYNPHLGLIPTEQEVLYDNVYSNTRLRTFVGNSAYTNDPERYTVMARLVTTTIPDNNGKTWTRTRVCVRPWDADKRAFGKEQVIAFNVNGLSSINRHDVDFDIDCLEYKGELLLVMGITSICVEGDEDLPFEQAKDRQFLTFLVWNATASRLNWASTRYYLLSQGFSTYHPRVLVQGNPKDSDLANSHRCCFYYFNKNLNSKEQDNGIRIAAHSLTGAQITPNKGIDLYYGDRGTAKALPVDGRFLIEGTFEVASSDRTELETLDSRPNFVHTVLFWQGGVGGTFVRSFRANHDEMLSDSQITPSEVASFSRRGSEDSQALFTYTTTSKMPSEKKNHVIKYDIDARQLIDVELNAYSIDAHTTASYNGKRLYTVRLAEGTSNKLDDAALAALDAGALLSSTSHYVAATGANYGGAATDSDVCEPVYQLLESRWIESLGAYHEFYPIARLAFPPDTTSVLSSDDGQRDFVMTSITDIDQVVSDVYHVAVPDVLAIQCEGVYPDSPFAAEGDTVGYYVKVTNVGNTLVTGFTVTLRDGDGNDIDVRTCYDLRPYLQETQDNYHVVRDKKDEPTYNEDGSMASEFVEDIRDTSGVLWPGFTRTFLFSFTMPAGYEGETTFNVQVSDPRSNPYINELSQDAVLNQANVAAAVADHLSWLDASDFAEAHFGSNVQRIVDPRRHSLKLKNKTVSETLLNGFSAVPAAYVTEGETDDGGKTDGSGSSGSKGNGGTDTDKKSSAPMPRTGDDTGIVAGVVAAAAVAATAAGVAGLATDTEDDAS